MFGAQNEDERCIWSLEEKHEVTREKRAKRNQVNPRREELKRRKEKAVEHNDPRNGALHLSLHIRQLSKEESEEAP